MIVVQHAVQQLRNRRKVYSKLRTSWRRTQVYRVESLQHTCTTCPTGPRQIEVVRWSLGLMLVRVRTLRSQCVNSMHPRLVLTNGLAYLKLLSKFHAALIALIVRLRATFKSSECCNRHLNQPPRSTQPSIPPS